MKRLAATRRYCLDRSDTNGQLLGAAAFQVAQGVIEFAGKGPSDYSDFIIRESIDDAAARRNHRPVAATGEGAKHLDFAISNWADYNPKAKRRRAISEHAHGLHATAIGHVEAPFMDMRLVEDRLRKKSLRRHERGLARQGTVTTETLTTADEILPLLDAFFFDQHVARWKSAGVESLFTQAVNRDFYRAVTRHLSATGQLRFTVIRLDGAPIAAHFGFLQAGRFIWYKPSYEPTLSKLSPGEVLIKQLLELAKREGAREFDFTIGSEPFKFRFASGVRRGGLPSRHRLSVHRVRETWARVGRADAQDRLIAAGRDSTRLPCNIRRASARTVHMVVQPWTARCDRLSAQGSSMQTLGRIIWLAPDRFDVKPDKSTWLEMGRCLRELGWTVTILTGRKGERWRDHR